MRQYIFNFSQQILVKLNLTLTEALILDYLLKFIENGTCFKNINGKKYMWVSIKKVLDDLPILNIKERALRTILNKLEKSNIISKQTVQNKQYIYINKNILFFEEDHLCEDCLTPQDKAELKKLTAGKIFPQNCKNGKITEKNCQEVGKIFPTIVYYYKNKIKIITTFPHVKNVDSFTFLQTLKKELSKNVTSLAYDLSVKNLNVLLIEDGLIILHSDVSSILEKNYGEVFNHAIDVSITNGYNYHLSQNKNSASQPRC